MLLFCSVCVVCWLTSEFAFTFFRCGRSPSRVLDIWVFWWWPPDFFGVSCSRSPPHRPSSSPRVCLCPAPRWCLAFSQEDPEWSQRKVKWCLLKKPSSKHFRSVMTSDVCVYRWTGLQQCLTGHAGHAGCSAGVVYSRHAHLHSRRHWRHGQVTFMFQMTFHSIDIRMKTFYFLSILLGVTEYF